LGLLPVIGPVQLNDTPAVPELPFKVAIGELQDNVNVGPTEMEGVTVFDITVTIVALEHPLMSLTDRV
jgi:hypothetical protein